MRAPYVGLRTDRSNVRLEDLPVAWQQLWPVEVAQTEAPSAGCKKISCVEIVTFFIVLADIGRHGTARAHRGNAFHHRPTNGETMRIRTLLLGLTLPLLGACGANSIDTMDSSDGERGGLGKADLVGSCEAGPVDFCGGKGTGTCFCDDACVDFGDCCSDADTVCGIEPDEPDDDATLCGGFLGATCADDEYCAYEEGDHCGAADAASTCEPRPEVCPELFAPVCGCDGETYSNSCFAAGAGTGVLHDGECDTPDPEPGQFCGGIAGIQCPDGQICVQNPNSNCDPNLGGADCGGICVPDPDEPQCQPVLCELFCEHGFATDDDGCEVCSCAEPPEPEPCHIGGCNGELCVGPDAPDVSICIALPEAACFPLSTCGNFGPGGECGWEPTDEFIECMSSIGGQ
jgi:hypothetical protein